MRPIAASTLRRHSPHTAANYRQRPQRCSTVRVQCVKRGDIEPLAAVFADSRARLHWPPRNFALTVIAAVNIINLDDVKIRLEAVTKARLSKHNMVLVMTVRNPVDAMRAPLAGQRARASANSHVQHAIRICQLINESYGPRGGQTAMRGARLRWSRCMTDKVM
jgi:hypothetical protein